MKKDILNNIINTIMLTIFVALIIAGIVFIFYVFAVFVKAANVPKKYFPQCPYYKISVFGEDKYAGQDYDLAKDMSNGQPVYLSRFKEDCK